MPENKEDFLTITIKEIDVSLLEEKYLFNMLDKTLYFINKKIKEMDDENSISLKQKNNICYSYSVNLCMNLLCGMLKDNPAGGVLLDETIEFIRKKVQSKMKKPH